MNQVFQDATPCQWVRSYSSILDYLILRKKALWFVMAFSYVRTKSLVDSHHFGGIFCFHILPKNAGKWFLQNAGSTYLQNYTHGIGFKETDKHTCHYDNLKLIYMSQKYIAGEDSRIFTKSTFSTKLFYNISTFNPHIHYKANVHNMYEFYQ